MQDLNRSIRTGIAWKAIGKRHGKLELEPLAVMKYMPKPIQELKA